MNLGLGMSKYVLQHLLPSPSNHISLTHCSHASVTLGNIAMPPPVTCASILAVVSACNCCPRRASCAHSCCFSISHSEGGAIPSVYSEPNGLAVLIVLSNPRGSPREMVGLSLPSFESSVNGFSWIV